MTNVPKHILIVDDQLENLLLLASMLREQGYKTRQLPEAALVMQMAKQVPPDLILLDVMMPHLNGYEVCQQLKADPLTTEIPVIFISALDDVFDKVKAFQCGCVDFITKPFQIEEVLARIDSQLKIQHLQKELQAKNRSLEEAYLALENEQRRSEQLLLNILPESIVARLKHQDETIADRHEHVTVLFADIVGFTELAIHIDPVQLVQILNHIFSNFDRLAEKYCLEKIKTIGDAYMVASGLPHPRENSEVVIAEMALDMQKVMQEFSDSKFHPLSLRIGFHSGEVVAGVIGLKKFAYDLWGDTVNTASRMESHGLPGEIQTGEMVYQKLRHNFHFEKREGVNIKGKGKMNTYLLKGRIIADQ